MAQSRASVYKRDTHIMTLRRRTATASYSYSYSYHYHYHYHYHYKLKLPLVYVDGMLESGVVVMDVSRTNLATDLRSAVNPT
jgi:hypothetical protein